jgi:hypothetical protein
VPSKITKEARNVDSKRKRITSGILAVLAATVVACGSVGAGSEGRPAEEHPSDGNYITADDYYGVGPQIRSTRGGDDGAPRAVDEGMLQP